jgi:hypothetical protein
MNEKPCFHTCGAFNKGSQIPVGGLVLLKRSAGRGNIERLLLAYVQTFSAAVRFSPAAIFITLIVCFGGSMFSRLPLF